MMVQTISRWPPPTSLPSFASEWEDLSECDSHAAWGMMGPLGFLVFLHPFLFKAVPKVGAPEGLAVTRSHGRYFLRRVCDSCCPDAFQVEIKLTVLSKRR